MIKFHSLSTSNRDLIESFTMWGNRQNCDLSFANLISWRFLYDTQYAIVGDYLVFRFYAGRHLAYMTPIARPKPLPDGTLGVEPSRELSIEVLKAIRDDSIAMGHPFLLMGVCSYMVEKIEAALPGTFDMKLSRDYSDYIYTREKLANLAGKHLQSKRNHINKFKKLYPGYEYKPLTPELIPECLRLEQEWRRNQEQPGQEEGTTTTTPYDESRIEELRSMTRAFDRWHRLQLTGGTIWVDGTLVAFTFGGPINHCTFDVCVEKADTSYEGAFSIINQEFVRHLPEQYIYINREEDMGEAGLRKSKLSYKPDLLLEKYTLTEKHPLADFEDQARIYKETRALWQLVFDDPEPFIDLYFTRVYKSEYNYTCQIGRHVVAALQALPYTMLYHGREVPTAYMSGVSVHPDWRKQDVGNNLMRQAHFAIYFKGVVFATLIPAEQWLYGWYHKCGYAECITCTPPPRGIGSMTYHELDRLQRQQQCGIIHDREGYDIIQADYRLCPQDYDDASKQPLQGMTRVVNALKALQLYAAQHPDYSGTIRVQNDKDIPHNNGYYRIAAGQVLKSDEPDAQALKLDIAQLARFIFDGEHATMSLMLN